MDVTVLFNDYLASKGAQRVLQDPFEISKLNGFMVDAYRINSLLNDLVRYLRSIRGPYLTLQTHRTRAKFPTGASTRNSAQPFTEEQRKLVDRAMNDQLTRIDRGIEELSSVANLDLDVKTALRGKRQEKRGFGALGRWAAGGADIEKTPDELEDDARLETEKAHRDGIIFSLRMRLQHAGRVQEAMVEARVKREIERSQNVLSKSRADRLVPELAGPSVAIAAPEGIAGTLSPVDLELEASSRAEREQLRHDLESQMSTEQLQQLQSEETSMLKHYNSELEKIQRAQQSVLEISQLQTELTMHLNVQAENISQLVSDSFETAGNVEEGNKQLEQAKRKFRPAQWMFYGAVGTGVFLVGWDLVF